MKDFTRSATAGNHISDTAAEAEKAAYITAGIPGCKLAAKKVAKLACQIDEILNIEGELW